MRKKGAKSANLYATLRVLRCSGGNVKLCKQVADGVDLMCAPYKAEFRIYVMDCRSDRPSSDVQIIRWS